MEQPSKAVWNESHKVYASDTDVHGQGKLSFILDMLQHAADSAVEGMGVSLSDLLQAEMGWMLMTLDVQIGRLPQQGDRLNVRTWSKGTKGPLWQRDYRILDEQDGGEIISARSTWALVDIVKRKILRPSALRADVHHYTGDSVGDMPDKVAIPGELRLEEAYRYQVRYSGLDNYGHLNNAKYGDVCSDALPLEIFRTGQLQRFRITYLQEAAYGDEIAVNVGRADDSEFYLRGMQGGKVFFEADMELKQ
ncbi:Acyl-ACP thioesterase [compost metagenome]